MDPRDEYPSDDYPYSDDGGFVSDDIDIQFTYSDLSRVTAGRGPMMTEKSLLTPLDSQFYRIDMALRDYVSTGGFTEGEAETSRTRLERLDQEKILLSNAELLATAALFNTSYPILDKKNFKSFIDRARGLDFVNHLDAVRYIKMLQSN